MSDDLMLDSLLYRGNEKILITGERRSGKTQHVIDEVIKDIMLFGQGGKKMLVLSSNRAQSMELAKRFKEEINHYVLSDIVVSSKSNEIVFGTGDVVTFIFRVGELIGRRADSIYIDDADIVSSSAIEALIPITIKSTKVFSTTTSLKRTHPFFVR